MWAGLKKSNQTRPPGMVSRFQLLTHCFDTETFSCHPRVLWEMWETVVEGESEVDDETTNAERSLLADRVVVVGMDQM